MLHYFQTPKRRWRNWSSRRHAIGRQEKQSGDYYRIDYDPHLDRFSASHPGWWNIHDYLDRPRLLDGSWYETLAAGLAAKSPIIELGRMANDWPAVSVACLSQDRTWLRADLSLGRTLRGVHAFAMRSGQGARDTAIARVQRDGGEAASRTRGGRLVAAVSGSQAPVLRIGVDDR
jgi:hypothetical protein